LVDEVEAEKPVSVQVVQQAVAVGVAVGQRRVWRVGGGVDGEALPLFKVVVRDCAKGIDMASPLGDLGRN
jgi:hypothetical protein